MVPSASLPPQRGGVMWVRNGLGRTSAATVEPPLAPLEGLGVSVLRLATKIDPLGELPLASRPPFAGSAGYVVEFAESAQAEAAWPQMHQGFLGAYMATGSTRRLGIDVPAGPRGGAVFDAQGRLAGISVPGANGVAMMLPVSTWASAQATAPAPASLNATSMAPTPEMLYEKSLPIVLQVIVAQ
ncbi:MAG: hypothetical protein H7Y61_15920 [Rhizobiales bacterium]|nr:hypothetical protein [Rhizobacter sp.]